MKPEIVAELSGNHGGSLDNCFRLIHEAENIGVDRIKFQRFEPHWLAKKRQALFPDTDLLALYKQTETPLEWWGSIKEELDGYPFSCSVFSEEDALFMVHSMGCEHLKIASFELTDLALIQACAKLHKRLTLSVNMSATALDVLAAYQAAQGARMITFLMATPYFKDSLEYDERLQEQADRYRWLMQTVPPAAEVGLSDHSPPDRFALTAHVIEQGAAMLERHLCLPDVETPDSAFSSTPEQFARYMERITKYVDALRPVSHAEFEA